MESISTLQGTRARSQSHTHHFVVLPTLCSSLTSDFQNSRLYIHGLQEEFLVENGLEKLEALSGGAALALTRIDGDLQYYKVFDRNQTKQPFRKSRGGGKRKKILTLLTSLLTCFVEPFR